MSLRYSEGRFEAVETDATLVIEQNIVFARGLSADGVAALAFSIPNLLLALGAFLFTLLGFAQRRRLLHIVGRLTRGLRLFRRCLSPLTS